MSRNKTKILVYLFMCLLAFSNQAQISFEQPSYIETPSSRDDSRDQYISYFDFDNNNSIDVLYVEGNSVRIKFTGVESGDFDEEVLTNTEQQLIEVSNVVKTPENEILLILTSSDEIGLYKYSNFELELIAERHFDLAPKAPRIADIDSDGGYEFVVSESYFTLKVFDSLVDLASSLFKTYHLGQIRDFDLIDINNDSHLDLVVSSNLDESVSILFHDGNEFSEFQTFQDVNEYVYGDFNNDELIDFGFAKWNTTSLTIYHQTEHDFNAVQTVNTTTTSSDFFTTDFDEDGNVDILISNFQRIISLDGIGNGEFAEGRVLINHSHQFRPVKHFDLEHSTFPDVVGTHIESAILVDFNFDDPVLSFNLDIYPFKSFINLGASERVLIEDIDNDGNKDLIIPSSYGGLFIYFGDGLSFSKPTIINTMPISYLSLFDLDNDQDLDIVIGEETSYVTSAIQNTGDRSFSAIEHLKITPENASFAVVKSDSEPDKWLSWKSGSDKIYFFSADDNVEEYYDDDFDGEMSLSYPVSKIFVKDFNEDGRDDLFISYNETDKFSIFSNDGSNFSESWTYGSGYEHNVWALPLIFSDLNNDGIDELLLVRQANGFSNLVDILSETEDNLFESIGNVSFTLEFSNPENLFAGDLDNDSFPEIYVGSYDHREGAFFTAQDDQGYTEATTNPFLSSNQAWLGFCDANQDSKPDLLKYNSSSGLTLQYNQSAPISDPDTVPNEVLETRKDEQIYLYPNPFTEVIHINSSQYQGNTYTLLDYSGKEIQKGIINSKGQIRTQPLQKGAYILKIFDINGGFSQLIFHR